MPSGCRQLAADSLYQHRVVFTPERPIDDSFPDQRYNDWKFRNIHPQHKKSLIYSFAPTYKHISRNIYLWPNRGILNFYVQFKRCPQILDLSISLFFLSVYETPTYLGCYNLYVSILTTNRPSILKIQSYQRQKLSPHKIQYLPGSG